MSIWKAKLHPSGQSKCKRCGRWFQPRNPDQEYGPTCARKIEEHEDDLRLKAADKAGELE